MNTFNKWFAGLISAGISGGATTAAAAVVMPDLLYAPGGWQKLAMMFGAGAAIGVLNYLKQSPLVETK